MKLSIIVPSQRIENMSKCNDAIKAGTFCDYEVILVSSKLHYRDEETIEKRINVFDDKCTGTTYAIQKGLEEASGDYIVALSDDALVCPHWADHMINFLEKQPKDKILLGNFRVFDHTGEMGTIGYYGHPFSMFPIMRRADIEKVGGYFSTEFNAYYSDPDLGLRVATANGVCVTCPTAFIYHVYNPDQLHLDNKSKYWAKDEETFKKKWASLGAFTGCQKL